MKIHCKYDELIAITRLKPYPKNRNSHSEEQVERLAKLIEYQGMRAPIVVVKDGDEIKTIAKGHGTLLALKKLGWDTVPIVHQEFLDEDQLYTFVQSDNAIASWSELDLKAINLDLPDLGPFDIDLLGIDGFVVEPADKLSSEEENYTNKIQAPIYEPSGPKPDISELYDKGKAESLSLEINRSKLPEEIKSFLLVAAQRHVVFDYEKIAEFYAHSSKKTQQLMENSALVIIDFKKAIEKGFVNLSKRIAEAYLDEA